MFHTVKPGALTLGAPSLETLKKPRNSVTLLILLNTYIIISCFVNPDVKVQEVEANLNFASPLHTCLCLASSLAVER